MGLHIEDLPVLGLYWICQGREGYNPRRRREQVNPNVFRPKGLFFFIIVFFQHGLFSFTIPFPLQRFLLGMVKESPCKRKRLRQRKSFIKNQHTKGWRLFAEGQWSACASRLRVLSFLLRFAVGPGSLSFLIHHSSSFPQRINWFEKKTDEWERTSLGSA